MTVNKQDLTAAVSPVLNAVATSPADANGILASVDAEQFQPPDLRQALQGTSLADLDIPQSLHTDEQGQLIADEGVRELMDFFLGLTGERDAAQIRSLFAAAASAQCSSACAKQALAIYDRYQQYLTALQSASPQLQATDDLRSRVEWVGRARAEMLGDELAQALFAYDNAYADLRLAQRDVQLNTKLSAEEKMQALAELQANLPPELAAREQENARLHAIRALNRELAQQNADESTRSAARSEMLNADEIERLRTLDEQRAQWDQRYQRYRSERVALDQASLDAVDRDQAIAQLRQQYFSALESQRAVALDRINGLEQ